MEQSSQYLPEITNRLAGQAPSPLAESTVKFLSLGWFQRWGRMVHLSSVIGHVTEWASQGFSRKKGSLDSSSASPGSLHWAHMHPAHSIPHSHCRWAISPLSIFTQIFSRCAKNDVGTYSECLPSERVCPCKHGCMRAHISEIRILLCRCVSNPEPFKMLIFVCFYNILIHCSLNEGSQAFFIPLQLPNGHWYKNLLPQKNVPKEQQMQWILGIGLKPFLSVYSNNPL